MRTNGEIERDAKAVSHLRRIADALDAIGATLAEINRKLDPPVFLTPKEALDVVDKEALSLLSNASFAILDDDAEKTDK